MRRHAVIGVVVFTLGVGWPAAGLSTGGLLEAMSVAGSRLENTLTDVQSAIGRVTQGWDAAWTSSSAVDEIDNSSDRNASRAAPPEPEQVARQGTATTTQTSATRSEHGNEHIELLFWESIESSDRAQDYEAYLEAYPKGHFAPLAKVRAKYLQKKHPEITRRVTQKIESMDAAFEVMRGTTVWATPATESRSLAQLERGARVRVTGRVVDRNWYRIETDTGIAGFVFGNFNRETLPRVAVKPVTPVPRPRPQAADPPLTISAVHSRPATAVDETRNDDNPQGHALPTQSADAPSSQAAKPVAPMPLDTPAPPDTQEVSVGKATATFNDGVAKTAAEACLRISRKLSSVTPKDCMNGRLSPTGARSVKGVPILVKEYPPLPSRAAKGRVLILGGIHGDEYSSVSIVFNWMKTLDKHHSGLFHWRVAPLVNTDGLLSAKARRTNANGVDLNRNFPMPNWAAESHNHWIHRTGRNPRRYPGPQPLSEPESRWIAEEIERFNPDVIVAMHAPHGVVDFDGPASGPPRLGHLKLNLLGTYPGSLGNYAGVQHHIPVITIELPFSRIMPTQQQTRKIWMDLVNWLKRNVPREQSPELQTAEADAG